MRISYDAEADALYIRLIEGEIECRNVPLREGVTLDLGPQDQLVGIEVLNPATTLGTGDLPQVVIDNLRAVAA